MTKNVKFKYKGQDKQGKLYNVIYKFTVTGSILIHLVHVAGDKKIYEVTQEDLIEVTT